MSPKVELMWDGLIFLCGIDPADASINTQKQDLALHLYSQRAFFLNKIY